MNAACLGGGKDETSPVRWTPGWLMAPGIPLEQRLRLQALLEQIQDWQQEHALPSDGLIGPHTWSVRDERLIEFAYDFYAALHRADIRVPLYRYLQDVLTLEGTG